MILFKRCTDIEAYLSSFENIGFVPTMGALHQGHISLLEKSRQENQITVCSIFVNPTQFNNKEDFDKYPIHTEKDILILEKTKCNVLFLPSVEEIYPPHTDTPARLNFGFLGTTLEGEKRPGHFDGVAQVVDRLLNIIKPTRLYMGLKDYQQVMIVKKMLEIKKSNVQLIPCPTFREPNGLAMSSRNLRLSEEEKTKALELSKTLFWINENFWTMPLADLLKISTDKIKALPEFKLEYIEIRKVNTLEIPTFISSDENYVALIAAWIGGVRLIDNLQIDKKA